MTKKWQTPKNTQEPKNEAGNWEGQWLETPKTISKLFLNEWIYHSVFH